MAHDPAQTRSPYFTYRNQVFSHDKVQNRRKVCPVHYHADEHELYYLVSGETKYFVGDEIFHMSRGDFIFIPKGVLHRTDSEECLHNERLLLSFDDSLVDPEAAPALDWLARQKLVRIPAAKQYLAQELLHQLQREADDTQAPCQRLMLKLKITELLITLQRYGEACQPRLTQVDRVVQNILDYIGEHYGADLTLRSLSGDFAVSESHLSRRFKAYAGMGLCEYIRCVRIHHATELLEQTDASITQIAALCGFNDSNYFSNVFKKMKGVTPYRYAGRFRRRGRTRNAD